MFTYSYFNKWEYIKDQPIDFSNKEYFIFHKGKYGKFNIPKDGKLEKLTPENIKSGISVIEREIEFADWKNEHDERYIMMGYISMIPNTQIKEKNGVEVVTVTMTNEDVRELFGSPDKKPLKLDLNKYTHDLERDGEMSDRELKSFLCGIASYNCKLNAGSSYGGLTSACFGFSLSQRAKEQIPTWRERIQSWNLMFYYEFEDEEHYDTYHTTNLTRFKKFLEEIGFVKTTMRNKMLKILYSNVRMLYISEIKKTN